jgi:hypothetical protein
LRKASAHGLGVLLAPSGAADTPWTEEVWLRVIARARSARETSKPAWYESPALTRVSASSAAVLRAFEVLNDGRPYAAQVKPANFLLLAHDDPLIALPDGIDRNRLTLVAPYSSDPRSWLSGYRNRFDGAAIRTTTRPEGAPGAVRIKTIGDVVADYGRHPEAKSGDSDGAPCTRSTVGLLHRLRIVAAAVRHHGKESNRLDDVQAGAIRRDDDLMQEYIDERGEWELALPYLRSLGSRRLAESTGMSMRTLRSRLNSGRLPRRPDRKRLIAVARRLSDGT